MWHVAVRFKANWRLYSSNEIRKAKEKALGNIIDLICYGYIAEIIIIIIK